MENWEKGENAMNAYSVKPTTPFVTRKTLARTPASKENREMIKYIESHEFSIHYDQNTGQFVCGVKEKR